MTSPHRARELEPLREVFDGKVRVGNCGEGPYFLAELAQDHAAVKRLEDYDAAIKTARAEGAASAYGAAAQHVYLGSHCSCGWRDNAEFPFAEQWADHIKSLAPADATRWQQERDRQQREEGKDDILVALADAASQCKIEGFTWDATNQETSVKSAIKLFRQARADALREAAEACDARVDHDHYRYGNREAEQCAIAIRNLASEDSPCICSEAYGIEPEKCLVHRAAPNAEQEVQP